MKTFEIEFEVEAEFEDYVQELVAHIETEFDFHPSVRLTTTISYRESTTSEED